MSLVLSPRHHIANSRLAVNNFPGVPEKVRGERVANVADRWIRISLKSRKSSVRQAMGRLPRLGRPMFMAASQRKPAGLSPRRNYLREKYKSNSTHHRDAALRRDCPQGHRQPDLAGRVADINMANLCPTAESAKSTLFKLKADWGGARSDGQQGRDVCLQCLPTSREEDFFLRG